MEKKTSSSGSMKRPIHEISTSKTMPESSSRVLRDEAQAKAEDPSSRLVERIFEKGFSSSVTNQYNKPSVPRPTVLPFPVARHRSHGPHWAPITSEMDVDDDNNNEDKDEADFCLLASIANPLERKQKKTLNCSRWRELIAVSMNHRQLNLIT